MAARAKCLAGLQPDTGSITPCQDFDVEGEPRELTVNDNLGFYDDNQGTYIALIR